MKYIRLLFALSIYTMAAPVLGTSVEAVQVSSPWQEVAEYAQVNLPQEGQLIVKSDGFGYIKVDDEYIHTLFPMLGLEEEGYKKPPYFRSEDSPGAHISIFYVDENIAPEEVGQTFPFELKEIVIVRPSKSTSYVVFQVSSPELERLREKYGLEGKLHGHEYHISLGKKVTYTPKN